MGGAARISVSACIVSYLFVTLNITVCTVFESRFAYFIKSIHLNDDIKISHILLVVVASRLVSIL